MMDGLGFPLIAMAMFVGFHVLLAHPLRAAAIRLFGKGGFQLVYSALAIALLLLVLVAYHAAPREPVLWPSDYAALQACFGLAGWFATALFIASLSNNPGLVGAETVDLSTRIPSGVYRITRHPMMFAIAIFALLQIAINASLRNVIVLGGFAVLALVGSWLQDGKKIAQTGREWTQWSRRTPFWPDLRKAAALGVVWPIALVVWLTASWLETRLIGIPVGLWYFLPAA